MQASSTQNGRGSAGKRLGYNMINNLVSKFLAEVKFIQVILLQGKEDLNGSLVIIFMLEKTKHFIQNVKELLDSD